jgi:hypothetical protein
VLFRVLLVFYGVSGSLGWEKLFPCALGISSGYLSFLGKKTLFQQLIVQQIFSRCAPISHRVQVTMISLARFKNKKRIFSTFYNTIALWEKVIRNRLGLGANRRHFGVFYFALPNTTLFDF